MKDQKLIPEGYSVHFGWNKASMTVKDAAGHGGDVLALGRLPSVSWEPVKARVQKLTIQKLPNGTIPIRLNTELLKNFDVMKAVMRHEIAEGKHLMPFIGKEMSTNQAFRIGEAAHRAGMKAQGFEIK